MRDALLKYFLVSVLVN